MIEVSRKFYPPKPMDCPKCGSPIKDARSVQPDRTEGPKPGEVGLCSTCGEVLMLTESQDLVVATDEMVSQKYSEREVEVLHAWQAALKERIKARRVN